MTRIVPESLRQRTGACFFQDLWLFERPWPFGLADLPAHVQKSVHIWHGTGDKQVSVRRTAPADCSQPLLQAELPQEGRPWEHSSLKDAFHCLLPERS